MKILTLDPASTCRLRKATAISPRVICCKPAWTLIILKEPQKVSKWGCQAQDILWRSRPNDEWTDTRKQVQFKVLPFLSFILLTLTDAVQWEDWRLAPDAVEIYWDERLPELVRRRRRETRLARLDHRVFWPAGIAQLARLHLLVGVEENFTCQTWVVEEHGLPELDLCRVVKETHEMALIDLPTPPGLK